MAGTTTSNMTAASASPSHQILFPGLIGLPPFGIPWRHTNDASAALLPAAA